MKKLVLAGLVMLLAVAQAEARSSRKNRWKRTRDKIRKARENYKKSNSANNNGGSDSDALNMGRASDGEKPVAWMSDFEEASKLASEQKRGMLILFTTEDLMAKSRSCTFKANSTRRAVRNSKAVPLRILPPVRLQAAEDTSKEELAKREELFKKSLKQYRELVRRYGITNGPSLVFTAPDAKRVDGLVVPDKVTIENRLGRLGEMLAAYEKALVKKNGGDAKKPDVAKPADKGKDEEKKDDEIVKQDGGKEEEVPGDPEDDF